MKKLLSIDWRCDCEEKVKVWFKKPHPIEATHVKVQCTLCESTWLLKISKLKGGGPNDVSVWKKVLVCSPTLAQILKEDAEHKAKPLEEIDRIEKGEV